MQLTDEEIFLSSLSDIIGWAEGISGEWNGKLSGSKEDRAHQANDIIGKATELQELIRGMEEL